LHEVVQIRVTSGIGPSLNDCSGKRIVVDPLDYLKAFNSNCSYGPTPIDIFLRVHNAEEGSEVRSLVVAADFAPPFDEHRTEEPIR